MSDEEFFRSPGMSRIREMWCAAHYARAYSEQLQPCVVRLDDVDEQSDVDFELAIGDRWEPFQVAEVMEPDRRRGDEYKNFVPSLTRVEDWSRGTEQGAEWIRKAIERKIAKRYSRASDLNLLLYLNFPAYAQEYDCIRGHCASEASQFKSVWLLNCNAFCCLSPSPTLRSFWGWLHVPESLADDA